jgi:hypothetical protein
LSGEVSARITEIIDPDEILKQEFAYASASALQANADRTQIVNLYLLLVGGIGSLLAGLPALARGEGFALPRGAYAGLLSALALLGLFTVLKLIKLRQAWHDSVLAMNRIKDFYLTHFPELAPAFRWRTDSIPAPGRAFTITFDLVALVALIDSAALGAAVAVAQAPLPGSIAIAAAFLAAQAALFVRLLPQRAARDGAR